MTTIRFERDGAVGNIVLANPPFNRLDLRFAEALRVAVYQASKSDIRVLVIRSEGPHFSFGGEVREWPGKDVNWFRTFVAEVNASYRAIEMLKIPTVAVVQGVAFGGGFELALACDFLVAAENTTFRCVEAPTDRHRRCRSKGPRHFPLAALGQSQCRWRRICSPVCRKSKRPDSAGSTRSSINMHKRFCLGDAGLALNFRGNEHVPPSSHTDLWPDNCTDSRLLSLNLSAAGP